MDDVQGMRVALVLATSAGGVGRHVRAVAAGLAERGAKVAVLGPGATERTFGFSGPGVRFAEVDISDRPRPAGDLAAVRRLRGLVRGADVVHAHGLRAGGLAVMARGRFAGRGPALRLEARPPVLVTLHNAPPAGGVAGAAYGALERIVARGASGVLAVSPDLAERMRALGAREVGHAIVPAPPRGPQPGADVRERLREELGAGSGQVVLTVARLAEQKGLPVLLEAVERLGERAPLVLIAGDGPLDGVLRDRIASADLPVRLLGRRNDVPDLLAACDVVAVPSLWEGQPLFVQEALRAGRPIVATATGGVPGLVDDAAVLVPPGDPAALAEALGGVLSDSARAVRLGAAAAQRATALPTDDDAVDQLAARYRGFLPT
ncbi:glycosyltransferase [Actinocorallia sp. API 0066]|uniref:glycosyltransferase n=1 Tax=Actinocorallia sp. API 0066 TaxID=2896846 RepID=UPI001E534E1A|nr:glycosyltransferase [Actinocorallia sp. API 0066]MCD0453654.1 glycosyltransferase [Actinocorallia sp. API 0066]